MSKMRLYQLAKELNIDSTELISRLTEMGINVSSHMSALKEEVITKVKNRFLGTMNLVNDVEEERIAVNVIRRRAKKSQPEEEITGEAEELKPEEIVKKEASPQEVAPAIPATTEVERKEEEVEQKPVKKELTKRKEKKKVEPAKIIQKAPAVKKITAVKEQPEQPEQPIAAEVSSSGKKRKIKSKEKRGGDVPQNELPNVKLTRKKRAVIVGEDIYQEKKRFKSTRSKFRKDVSKSSHQKTQITTPKAIKRKIRISEGITAGELAKRMSVKANDVIKELMNLGLMLTINQTIDSDSASLIAQNYNYEIEEVSLENEILLEDKEDSPQDMLPRPPVVTVMGHVDHGKTSFLDAIRKTKVIENEAGGITQHIGAYHINLENGTIVFLDTPGHEAFTAMRARGAQVTDIVILVVAADEGVKAQTEEAINHAKAANVPIIVAINKIDKPNADPGRIKQDLTKYELVPEEWGGDTIFVEVSAKQGKGIKESLDMILLQAEMLELKANPNKNARGVIIEARLDKSQGPVVTALIQEGTLKQGDPVIVGAHFGKVRSMANDQGERIINAGPSMPVEVHGLSGVPQAGDILTVLSEEKKARQVGIYRQQKQRENSLVQVKRVTLEDLSERFLKGEIKDLNVIIKADVQGSVEALAESLKKCDVEDVKLKILQKGVGAITEMDVLLAAASSAIIIGYRIKPDLKIQLLAKGEGVDVRAYDVIYNVISDIQKAVTGLLKPVLKEVFLGRAEIRNLFTVPKAGVVAGSFVIDGKIIRGSNVRLIRDSAVIYEGKMASLRRFKDDVKEVSSGFECGIGIQNFNDIKPNDIIESYNIEEVLP